MQTTRRRFSWRDYALWFLFIALFLLLLIFSPTFRNPQNLLNLLQQNAVNGILACGITLILIGGGFDLSVGATAALSGMVAAAVFIRAGIPLGILAALLASLAIGVTNGLLVAKVRVNPFVATLGTQIIVRGALYISTNAAPIYGLPVSWMKVGLGYIGPFPIATTIFVCVVVFSHVLLKHTPFGQYLLSTGGNEEASRLSGIRVDMVKTAMFAIGGIFAGIAGLILLGQTNTGQSSAASGYELNAMAAAVVGGTSLSGGQGSIPGAVLGVLLLGMVGNALNLMNVSPYWQPAVTGSILLLTVSFDTVTRKK
ncbi:MAG: ABC transporter permease [Synergistaceae bacterium]|jgi:ribose transport system permease protein/putative xylitol transport system permease protein|nr:ABC transporter permease [Synergistaceae bacterium]